MDSDIKKQESIFVTFAGLPNAGKSSLLNKIAGKDLSVVTRKAQTTRMVTHAVLSKDNKQVVLADVPGFFASGKVFEKKLVSSAIAELQQAELALLIVDVAKIVNKKNIEGDLELLLRKLSQLKIPKILVMNKIDLIRRDKLLSAIKLLDGEGDFEKVFLISAKTGSGVRDLSEYLFGLTRVSPWLYPLDVESNMDIKTAAEEITRAQIFNLLNKEIPYEITIETESLEKNNKGELKIRQLIKTRKDNYRKIIIGKNAETLKRINKSARREIETFNGGGRIHLFLHVVTDKKWKEKFIASN